MQINLVTVIFLLLPPQFEEHQDHEDKSEGVLSLTLVGKRSHLEPFTLRVAKRFCL